MTKSVTPFGVKAQRAGIFALTMLMLAAIEAYGAWYCLASAPGGDMWFGYPRAALLHSTLALACSLLSFAGMWAAATKKDDERPHIRRQAFGMQVLAMCFLFVPHGPIWNLASAIDYDAQLKKWEVFGPSEANPLGSEAYQIAKEKAQGFDYGAQERLYAQADITPPSEAKFSFWAVLASIVLNLLVMRTPMFRMSDPITEEEREALRIREAAEALTAKRKAAAAKGAATRKANAKAKAKSDNVTFGVTFGQKR